MFARKRIYSPAETILELISDVLGRLPSVLSDNRTEGYLQYSLHRINNYLNKTRSET